MTQIIMMNTDNKYLKILFNLKLSASSAFYLIIGIFFCLYSCQKNINLNLPQPPSQLCVDGYVQPGYPAYLFLTHNFAFFGNISASSVLNNDLIHGAVITVNDGVTTDTMVEAISSLALYATPHMRGITGRTYNLTVKAQGQT